MTGINPRGLAARTARPAAIALVVLAASIGFVSAVQASGDGVLQEPPRYGLYYDRYEPTFYTGFAPRTADPNRIHLRLGRGNQLRVTVVLSEAALEAYGRDLRQLTCDRANSPPAKLAGARFPEQYRDAYAHGEERWDRRGEQINADQLQRQPDKRLVLHVRRSLGTRW